MPEDGKSDSSTGSQTASTAHNAVFVSYASQDSALAMSLCAALESSGIACWIAPRDVRPGDFYADAIVHAINACQLLILVLSANSIASPHVIREVERASAKRRPIIAFRVDMTPLPAGLEYFLSASHWLDASAAHAEQSFPTLIEAIRGRSTAEPAASLPTGPPTTLLASAARQPAGGAATRSRLNPMLIAALVVIAAGLAYVLADKFWLSKRAAPASEAASAEPPGTAVSTAKSDKSVAVLPFADLSEKKDQEYFSDGLSEELIDLLGKIPGLHVPARTSSFYFKGKQTTLVDIAKALKVSNVLEGSVRKSGGNIRISADLVRVDDETHLWSETFDRKLDDIFKLQDEIADAVVKALKVSLLSADLPKAAPAANIDAYTLYLQGRSLIERFNLADNVKGADYEQQALKLDPNFAPAWVELSKAQVVGFAALGASTYEVGRAAAFEAADRALKLDPNLAGAHTAMGQVFSGFDWNWEAADREYKKAMALDPEDPGVLSVASQLAIAQGHYKEARELTQRAVARDPLGVLWYRQLGIADYFAGELGEAEAAFGKAIELAPTVAGVHYKLALVHLSRNDAKGALAEMELEPNQGWREQGLPLALDALGRKADADRALAIAEKAGAKGWAYQVGLTYAHRNNLDRAFVWFDSAFTQHDPGLAFYLKGEPLLANIRSDPRYKALLRKLNLPD
jgi:TolB-like protein/Tfp pilus assembly protein PilF